VLKEVKVAQDDTGSAGTRDAARPADGDPRDDGSIRIAAAKARGQTWKAEEFHAANTSRTSPTPPAAEHVKANPRRRRAAVLQLQKKQSYWSRRSR
jgi:hypothetical protein